MKFFFISDIHGALPRLQKALQRYEEEGASQILLLGDVMYHGPRNPLPEGYAPREVAQLLNQYKRNIIAVRGNCDSEVDQMLIAYPMMSDYALVKEGTRRLFLTHGHLYHGEALPPLEAGDLLVHGHTHVPTIEKKEGIYLFNPGSIALPKENHPATYGLLEGGHLQIKTLEGELYKEMYIP